MFHFLDIIRGGRPEIRGRELERERGGGGEEVRKWESNKVGESVCVCVYGAL